MKSKNFTTFFCPSCGNQELRESKSDVAVSGKKRYRCLTCKKRTTRPLKSKPQILPKADAKEIKSYSRYIITSAVNDTPINVSLHNTFIAMAKRLDARYIIIPGVYKNPDIAHKGLLETFSWPDKTLEYIVNEDVRLNRSLWLRGATRIQHTAVNPLSGMNHAGGIESEIFGHPQVAMQLIATPKSMSPKMLSTTGTISNRNYGGSKQAKKASFHHKLGGIYVELEGSNFWTTQLSWDGRGISLYNKYHTCEVSRSLKHCLGIVFGDIHVRFLTKKDRKNIRILRESLKPKMEIFHDLHDHYIGSHHTERLPLFNLKISKDRELFIEDELRLSVDFLRDCHNPVIVESNHHDHLEQWFNRYDPRRDTANLDFYYRMAEKAGSHPNRSLFESYLISNGIDATFAGSNKPFMIGGFDCSQHGHIATNGNRGSASAFAKTGAKTIIGHSHTPRIEKGCYQVGVWGIGEYSRGYSSWFNTNCIIYNNRKRAFISVVNDKLPPSLIV